MDMFECDLFVNPSRKQVMIWNGVRQPRGACKSSPITWRCGKTDYFIKAAKWSCYEKVADE